MSTSTHQNFRNKDITNTDFTGQDLSGSNFRDADISNCNFADAVLHYCNFKDSIQTDAIFDNAKVKNSVGILDTSTADTITNPPEREEPSEPSEPEA